MVARFGESRVVVMARAGRVLGFAGRVADQITWLFVHPDARQQGIATALIRQLLTEVGGPVQLNVARHNVAAIGLYSRLGFIVVNEFVGDVQGRTCPAWHMRHEGVQQGDATGAQAC